MGFHGEFMGFHGEFMGYKSIRVIVDCMGLKFMDISGEFMDSDGI